MRKYSILIMQLLFVNLREILFFFFINNKLLFLIFIIIHNIFQHDLHKYMLILY